jgi:hypothetical protein
LDFIIAKVDRFNDVFRNEINGCGIDKCYGFGIVMEISDFEHFGYLGNGIELKLSEADAVWKVRFSWVIDARNEMEPMRYFRLE